MYVYRMSHDTQTLFCFSVLLHSSLWHLINYSIRLFTLLLLLFIVVVVVVVVVVGIGFVACMFVCMYVIM